MKINSDFKDITIVNKAGNIEYIKVCNSDFFGFLPDESIGKNFYQIYTNVHQETSTFMRAIYNGEVFHNHSQILETLDGRIIRQYEDVYTIKRYDETVAAMELANYDEHADIIKSVDEKQRKEKDETFSLESLVGSSQEMMKLKRKISKIADADSSVLIMGQTGTGKELAARVIHACSNRRNSPFIYVNCSALPENLLEGLLFGIEKGSFTDAEKKDGLFKLADNGTIFLDEMDSMPLSIQAKLLKAIEEKSIRPLGSNQVIYVNVRIIATSGSDAKKILENRKIRSDLFFRLSVIQFNLLPLHDRGSDVLEIADHYVKVFNEKHHRDVKGFSAEARNLLMKHDWPGNVRELKNVVEGFFAISNKNTIDESDIQQYIEMGNTLFHPDIGSRCPELQKFVSSGLNLREYLQHEESRLISEALRHTGGNLSKASKELKISPALLRYKINNNKGFGE